MTGPPRRAYCPNCMKPVGTTLAGQFRKHDGDLKGVPCPQSGRFADPAQLDTDKPEEEDSWTVKFPVCPNCGRRPVRETDGTYRRHMMQPSSRDLCPMSGQPVDPSTPTEPCGTSATTDSPATPPENPTSTPGTSGASAATAAGASEPPKANSSAPASTAASAPKPSASNESNAGTLSVTPTRSAPADPMEDETRPPPGETFFGTALPVYTPGEGLSDPVTLSGLAAPRLAGYRQGVAPLGGATFQQPGAAGPIEGLLEFVGIDMAGKTVTVQPFQQPGPAPQTVTPKVEMAGLAKTIADTMKALFFAHAQTGRSAQHHLGPSEIGTPCDRRLVMRLLGMQPVNPGGDGWAAFVGTCVHAGLADMLTQASGNSGRFGVEMPIRFPSTTVPRGTADMLDRVLMVLGDHKAMGEWSLDKLKTQGPSEQYRIQAQVYAYGKSMEGETIKWVAIIGWPRTSASLDDLHVWVDAYDPAVGRAAINRADRLAAEVAELSATPGHTPQTVARLFAVDASDCRFCSFHNSKAVDLLHGCNGKA